MEHHGKERQVFGPGQGGALAGGAFDWQAKLLPPNQADITANLEKLAKAQALLEKEAKVAHGSGATSSHFSPFAFFCTYEGIRLTSMRFVEGNRKHEKSDPVYSHANWLKAFHARDVGFFRDRAGHALEHLIAEMRGEDDPDPGGNLGALGWFQDVMAYVKKNDPFLYACIQGKYLITDQKAEAEFNAAKYAQ